MFVKWKNYDAKYMKEKQLFSCENMSPCYIEYLADGGTSFVV